MMTIRFRAERRLGELMAAQKDAGLLSSGAANAGWKETRVEDAPVTLSEAGIDKNLADRARLICFRSGIRMAVGRGCYLAPALSGVVLST